MFLKEVAFFGNVFDVVLFILDIIFLKKGMVLQTSMLIYELMTFIFVRLVLSVRFTLYRFLTAK